MSPQVSAILPLLLIANPSIQAECRRFFRPPRGRRPVHSFNGRKNGSSSDVSKRRERSNGGKCNATAALDFIFPTSVWRSIDPEVTNYERDIRWAKDHDSELAVSSSWFAAGDGEF